MSENNDEECNYIIYEKSKNDSLESSDEDVLSVEAKTVEEVKELYNFVKGDENKEV